MCVCVSERVRVCERECMREKEKKKRLKHSDRRVQSNLGESYNISQITQMTAQRTEYNTRRAGTKSSSNDRSN